MVSRTAFAQLRRSWLLVLATLAGLALLFPLPPVVLVVGLVAGGVWGAALTALGAIAWVAMTASFLPTVRHYGLPRLWTLTLPAAGCLFGGMTLHSALRG